MSASGMKNAAVFSGQAARPLHVKHNSSINTTKMSEADIPKTMKAVICEKHGEPLKICQLPVPVPNDDEVLVKIRASGICHTDVHVCAGDLKSMLPVCPGHEGAGN